MVIDEKPSIISSKICSIKQFLFSPIASNLFRAFVIFTEFGSFSLKEFKSSNWSFNSSIKEWLSIGAFINKLRPLDSLIIFLIIFPNWSGIFKFFKGILFVLKKSSLINVLQASLIFLLSFLTL